MARPDWSRALPEPIVIGRRTLRTLADLSDYILALPEERQSWRGWQHTAQMLLDAAEGGDVQKAVNAFNIARSIHR